jgi:PTH1 family peptidyl-tRNA hydrolase
MDEDTCMAEMSLIVGLGNPGPRYENTRHNIGFRVVEELARKHGLSFTKTESRALVASGTILGKRVLLAKPMTYMNISGDAVAPLARFYKIAPANVMIVHDDLDIPPGTLRLRKSGSSGGQNGLKHIIERMGTQDIPRLRVGIGRPPGRMDAAAYVLTPFEKGDEEMTAVEAVDRAVKMIEAWLTDGIDLAMSRYNGPGGEKKPAKPPKQPTPEA